MIASLLRGIGAGFLLAAAAAQAYADNPFHPVPGAHFLTVLPDSKQPEVSVRRFEMQQHPVTNAAFLAFVKTQPKWQRGTVSPLFADADYLGHWATPDRPGDTVADRQPVTRVSWFAAQAYCESINARLPAWYEWEWAAAASDKQRDARSDPAWRQQILDWYSRPSSAALNEVEQRAPDIYGLYDLQGLTWEWVQDFNSLLPADADPEQFCGAGALNLQQKENYAVLMRVAMLGSLHAADTSRTLGFRCVRDVPEDGK